MLVVGAYRRFFCEAIATRFWGYRLVFTQWGTQSIRRAILNAVARRQRLLVTVTMERLLNLIFFHIGFGTAQCGMHPEWKRRRNAAHTVPYGATPCRIRCEGTFTPSRSFSKVGTAGLPSTTLKWDVTPFVYVKNNKPLTSGILHSPGEGCKVLWWVCPSVCLSARITRSQNGRTSPVFAHAPCGRGSVLLWQRCDKLCTSGFVDIVMFSHSGPIVARHGYS